MSRRLKTRFRIFLSIVVVIAAAFACGDSDDTPLGSQFIGDILGSTPGTVFEDTFTMAGGDTSYAFYSMIAKASYLDVGVDDGYERTIFVRADFSKAGSDTSRTVERASLRMDKIDYEGYVSEITTRFYQLGTEYSEGDSVMTLDTTFVIPDTTGAIDRKMQEFPRLYPLPPDLVQSWIRGTVPPNGIAIVYADNGDKLAGFDSRTADVPPLVEVRFTDQTESDYSMAADGIYTRPTSATDNLVISDGFVRRIHFPVDLSQIDDSSAVHQARLVLTYVPGTVFGGDQQVLLYLPDSSDPASAGFLKGRLITSATLDVDKVTLELPITNVLLQVLAGTLQDNGFVLRFTSENTEVRQAEFYSSGGGGPGPRVYVTYSTPADFEE
jgi:hypothetical protein